uniref:Uncharacterized protein n=1 Tax=Falco tinnunculus TaxID=100819 RepID=A0A8C4UUH6_FALTI
MGCSPLQHPILRTLQQSSSPIASSPCTSPVVLAEVPWGTRQRPSKALVCLQGKTLSPAWAFQPTKAPPLELYLLPKLSSEILLNKLVSLLHINVPRVLRCPKGVFRQRVPLQGCSASSCTHPDHAMPRGSLIPIEPLKVLWETPCPLFLSSSPTGGHALVSSTPLVLQL